MSSSKRGHREVIELSDTDSDDRPRKRLARGCFHAQQNRAEPVRNEEEADDAFEIEAPPPQPTRPRYRDQTRQEPGVEKGDEKLFEVLDPFEVARDDHLSNLARWDKVKNGLTISFRRSSDHSLHSDLADTKHVRDYLEGPVYKNRACIARFEGDTPQSKGKSLKFKVLCPGNSSFPSIGLGFNFPKEDYDRAEAQRIMGNVAKIWSRLPIVPQAHAGNHHLSNIVISIAAQTLDPPSTFQRSSLFWAKKSGYIHEVRYIDSKTFELGSENSPRQSRLTQS